VSWVTVPRCLDDMGYSLQANPRRRRDHNTRIGILNSGTSTGKVKALLGTGARDFSKRQEEGMWDPKNVVHVATKGKPRR